VKRAVESDLPKRIGRYEAFLQIGAGGMARVYLATQKLPGGASELVVIKQLKREVADDASVHALFVDEARIAMRLDHPNVVKTRDVVADPPNYYLAMEYLDGQSLLEVAKRLRQNIPLHEHLWILTQVLAGLRHAHELADEFGKPFGIVHRDVSPANVLVCYDGTVKLLDFGIAKATGAIAATQDGVVKGKLGYASPEQCLGKPADPRSDLYSVGVMLWEAVAGRRRSSGETRQAMLQARIDDADLALEDVRPDAPQELVAIARPALARDPEQRFRSARDFQTALERYLSRFSRPVGPAEVASLLEPHFADDRTAVARAIDVHTGGNLRGIRGTNRSGTIPRLPLPPPPPPPPLSRLSKPEVFDEDLDDADVAESFDDDEPEDTSPIPVDEALLIESRRRESQRPRPTSTMPSRPSAPSGMDAQKSVHELRTAPPPSSEAVGAQIRSTRSDFPSVQKKKPTLLFIGVGAAVGIAAVVGLMARGGANDESPSAEGAQAAQTVSTPAPEKASTPTAAVEPSAAAPKVGEVKVRVAVKPEGARIRVDGRLLKANPFVGLFPKDEREHHLTITADNYHEFVDILKFDQDLDIEISLDSTKGPARSRAAARIVRTPASAPAVAAAAAAPAPVIEKPAPAPRGAEPGMDMETSRPSAPLKRNLDEKDPYAQ
jgi:serine/threonine-protein kinase